MESMEGKLQKLKIAWFIEDFPNPYQVYIKNLLTNLKNSYGLNITVVTYKLLNKDLANDFRILEVKPSSFWDRLLRRITFQKLNKVERVLSRFDLVHIQHSFLFPVVRSLAGVSTNKTSFIITFRGADTYVKPWINPRWKSYHNEIRDNFSAVQVMSNNQKEYLLKWGHNLKNVFTIPISTSTFQDSFVSNEISSGINICSVFRMTWEKNIEANLRVIKRLVDKGLNITYNVFGDGEDFGQLYYLVDRFKLSEYVRIHGRVGPDVLAMEIGKNHLLLQLSSSEALPASVIEALSFGIPCIVSDVGGFPEIIQDGINGHLMNFNSYDIDKAVDFVMNVASSNELYQNLKVGAFETFKREFSPNVEAEKVSQMYSSVVSG